MERIKTPIELGETEKEVNISIGTLCKNIDDLPYWPDMVHIIVDIHPNTPYHSTSVIKNSNEGVWFGVGGSADDQDIYEIVGQLSPEEVITACKLGRKNLGMKYDQEVSNSLNFLISQGEKTITIKGNSKK